MICPKKPLEKSNRFMKLSSSWDILIKSFINFKQPYSSRFSLMRLSKTNCYSPTCSLVQTLPTFTDDWRSIQGESLRSFPVPGNCFSLIYRFVHRLYFFKDHSILGVLIFGIISKNSFWLECDAFRNKLKNHSVWSKDIGYRYGIFTKEHKIIWFHPRKENKGPYVPNRDIMKLFTNTPEARWLTPTKLKSYQTQ